MRIMIPVLGAAALLGAGAAHGLTPDESTERLEFPLSYWSVPESRPFVRLADAPLRAAALDADWKVQVNRRTGTAHFAYGSGLRLASAIGSDGEAAALAEEFVLANADLLGVSADNLALRNVAYARGKYAVHFRQVEGGIPVHRVGAWVVLGEAGEVMATGSDFFATPAEPLPAPLLSADDALAAAAADLGAAIRTDLPVETELLLVPVEGSGELWELAPAWRTLFAADVPFGDWETFVHAVTGEILARSSGAHPVDVVGTVNAAVQDFSYCDGISQDVLQDATVNVSGGGSADTDATGAFVIPHGGTSPVTLTTQLLGNFFNVDRFIGSDAFLTASATPGVPETIQWSVLNARQDEIDTFFHANRSHRFMVDIDPGFDAVALPQPMLATVGRTDGFCPGNAWYSITGKNINFCEAGGSYENTGEMGNVIYHEYGHGVSEELYRFLGSDLPSGDMHEGNSDIIANFIDRTSIVGIGFQNCSGGIRDADNNLQWPQDNNGGHFGGQIIAGFYWDAWQSMLAALPQAEADEAAWAAWHFSRVLGTPLDQPSQVAWTFIADDDDANLDNGTPHHEHFALGATNHGFTFPPIIEGIFIVHEKLPHTEDGSAGFDVVAEVTATGVTLDPSSIELHWRLNDGPFEVLPMAPTANPNEYLAHIPALSNFSEVDYFLRAADTEANETTDPEDAPSALYAFDVTFDYESGEQGPGAWTLGLPGDTAVRGLWELVDPVATLAQPGDDSTPGAGVNAFLTGQCGPPNCSGSCVLPQENSCNDVDFGNVTLLSPVYDLGGATAAKVKYDRWYSNDTGLSPGFDRWVVDVSNDGGATWTNVEDTNVSAAAWTPIEVDLVALFGTVSQVQVRFEASDVGNDSVVEAAVDEFRILADMGGAVDAPQLPPAPARVDFALSQNQPNPFGGATRVQFSLPAAADVRLAIYDVRGREVRALAAGRRDAGPHEVSWDGRDRSGRRVAAGTYFYRLEADGRTLTRKLTVLP